jgi:predicted transcriptional regulator
VQAIGLIPPCIVVVRYILPTIRAEIARELVKRYGLRRSEASKKMGVTPAAVTQYLEGLRGETASSMVKGSEEATKVVSQIAEDLVRNDASMCEVLDKMCKACRAIRSSGLLCEIHKKMLPALKGWEACDRPDHFCPSLGADP